MGSDTPTPPPQRPEDMPPEALDKLRDALRRDPHTKNTHPNPAKGDGDE
jgi:hypothetical protein